LFGLPVNNAAGEDMVASGRAKQRLSTELCPSSAARYGQILEQGSV